jgi:valyl-tRNA synthetase
MVLLCTVYTFNKKAYFNPMMNPLQPPSSDALSALATAFEPKAIENKWYGFWESNGLFKPEVALKAHWEAQKKHVPSTPQTYSIVIPPPNVTGTLHMGHALDNTIQDIFIRYHRMLGHETLWMPGTDHAGIATQAVVERKLLAGEIEGYPKGTTRVSLGKPAFLALVWVWSKHCQESIFGQFRRLGISPDWSRQRFTLDEGLSSAVQKTFVDLYKEGLIYRGTYIVNWDPGSESAISDIETEYFEEEGHLWHIAYPLASGEGEIVVATTRPETLYGDVAVAVHPKDPKLSAYIGQQVVVPLTGRTVPVIGDEAVELDFGTGALKITPAHDPNDYAIGQRHGLPQLLIFNTKAELLTLEGIPQALHGVGRWEARKQTEALLVELGLLRDKKAHTHRVGKAQRSGEVIEPLLSQQWFVKTKPLAETCLKALEAGELSFAPERWTKDYLRWMTNIQDWCISRQLWWGHQIPAWHHQTTGELYVGLEAPAGNEWVQDPDVLDTWFSSGLWPFSTMGWPDLEASDFKKFYPTSLLITGFDIIFFWVARMTMFGHQLTEKSPFEKVYIHGLVRDDKGQKMSKSKGNTVDPVEMIEALGCDGFRFGLTSLITYGGQDIRLAKEKLEQGKLFANKLWNASRFVMMNLESGPIAPQLNEALLAPMDSWILSRYEHTVAEANRLLQEQRLGEYAQLLLEFSWYQLCDWYVEYAKHPMRSGNPAVEANTRRVLLTVLEGVLKLLHPIMPYITEELWQRLPEKQGISISIAAFPTVETTHFHNPALETDMAYLLEVVRGLRNIRQQYTVPPSKPVVVIAETKDLGEQGCLERNQVALHHFVAIETLTIVPELLVTPDAVASNVVGQTRLLISLEGLVDVEQERQRLTKKRDTLLKDQQKLSGMMANEGFLAKAPPAVLQKNKDLLAELEHQLQLLEAQLSGL